MARAAAALDGLNDVLAQLRHTAEGNSDQLWQQPTRHKLDATPVSNEVTQSDDSGEISMTETTPPFHYGYDDDDDVTRSKSVYENVGEPFEMCNSEHFDSTFEKFQFLQKVDAVVVGENRSLPEKQVGSFKFTLLGFFKAYLRFFSLPSEGCELNVIVIFPFTQLFSCVLRHLIVPSSYEKRINCCRNRTHYLVTKWQTFDPPPPFDPPARKGCNWRNSSFKF